MVVPALVSSLTWVYLEAAGVLRFSAPGVSYLAYVLTGTMLWQVFAEALQTPLRRLDAARQLLTKSRVPHETWVLAGLADVVLGLVARFVVVVVVLIAVGTPLTSAVLLVPLGIAGLLMLGLGLGMLLVPVGLLYEDVGRGLTVATTLLFFLTPVIYAVPDRGVIGTVVNANPVTWLLQPTRAWLIDAPASGALPFAAVTAASFALLCATTIGYRLAQPHLVARL
jgi:lipopolysaccharide transport system permease protein